MHVLAHCFLKVTRTCTSRPIKHLKVTQSIKTGQAHLDLASKPYLFLGHHVSTNANEPESPARITIQGKTLSSLWEEKRSKESAFSLLPTPQQATWCRQVRSHTFVSPETQYSVCWDTNQLFTKLTFLGMCVRMYVLTLNTLKYTTCLLTFVKSAVRHGDFGMRNLRLMCQSNGFLNFSSA